MRGQRRCSAAKSKTSQRSDKEKTPNKVVERYARKLAPLTTDVGSEDDMKIGRFDLTLLQWLVVLILAAPPVLLALLNVGLGRWANASQDSVIGGHSPAISILAVLLLEFACLWLVAVAVRRITGRTIVELFRGNRKD